MTDGTWSAAAPTMTIDRRSRSGRRASEAQRARAEASRSALQRLVPSIDLAGLARGLPQWSASVLEAGEVGARLDPPVGHGGDGLGQSDHDRLLAFDDSSLLRRAGTDHRASVVLEDLTTRTRRAGPAWWSGASLLALLALLDQGYTSEIAATTPRDPLLRSITLDLERWLEVEVELDIVWSAGAAVRVIDPDRADRFFVQLAGSVAMLSHPDSVLLTPLTSMLLPAHDRASVQSHDSLTVQAVFRIPRQDLAQATARTTRLARRRALPGDRTPGSAPTTCKFTAPGLALAQTEGEGHQLLFAGGLTRGGDEQDIDIALAVAQPGWTTIASIEQALSVAPGALARWLDEASAAGLVDLR